jgi:UPF0042 nucleotide-binding protein
MSGFCRTRISSPSSNRWTDGSEKVKDFVLEKRETGIFLRKYLDLLDYLIPFYEKEGKAYLDDSHGLHGGAPSFRRSGRIPFQPHQPIPERDVNLSHRDINQQ